MTFPQTTSSIIQSDYDVIVLGAGAAGMTAALVAALGGLRVLLVESTPQVGGTSARSAGTLWVPGNASMTTDEARDDVAQARVYLDALVGDESDAMLRQHYLLRAPEMLAFLAQHTIVRFQPCPRHTDYFPELPGSSRGGRPVEAQVFDGRLLGAQFPVLRSTTPEFLVLGGMMISKADLDTLLKVTASLANLAHAARIIARYLVDRLRGYQRGTRLTMGNALCGRLFKSLLDAGVTLATECRVATIASEGAGVHTVSMTLPSGPVRTRALRGIVFAGGGYSANAAWRAAHMPTPVPQYTAAVQGATATTMELALGLGAVMGISSQHNAWWFPASEVRRDDGSVGVFPHIILDRAKPGLMAVDQAGRRFVNEGINYHQFCVAQYAQGAVPCWFICDHRFVRRYGLGAVRPGGRKIDAWLRRGYLLRAATLLELAASAGIEAAGLVRSVARMNLYAQQGVDPEFGKGSDKVSLQNGDAGHAPNPCLGAIDEAPFYALRVAPADLGTSLGLATNQHGQLLNDRGIALPGLYACGNDMNSIFGGRYPAPGTTLGPGMTFGYITARHLASSA